MTVKSIAAGAAIVLLSCGVAQARVFDFSFSN